MKQLAIIGSTASGKSDLSLSLAQECNAIILSIDSLSIYQEINIASAKPSPEELRLATHFGIDLLSPAQNASVMSFIDEYTRACDYAIAHGKNLIIVGGSSFYLKSMIDGLSEIPEFSPRTLDKAHEMLTDLVQTRRLLSAVDPSTMEKISPGDRYRTEKALLIYLETGLSPSKWFALHPPRPIIAECPVLELKIERGVLRERIARRTAKMIDAGLIDEVAELERRYGRAPNSMKAIGIVETLEYLDGKITLPELIEKITTHTAQLAKRQQTFNAHQFALNASGSADELRCVASEWLQ